MPKHRVDAVCTSSPMLKALVIKYPVAGVTLPSSKQSDMRPADIGWFDPVMYVAVFFKRTSQSDNAWSVNTTETGGQPASSFSLKMSS